MPLRKQMLVTVVSSGLSPFSLKLGGFITKEPWIIGIVKLKGNSTLKLCCMLILKPKQHRTKKNSLNLYQSWCWFDPQFGDQPLSPSLGWHNCVPPLLSDFWRKIYSTNGCTVDKTKPQSFLLNPRQLWWDELARSSCLWNETRNANTQPQRETN